MSHRRTPRRPRLRPARALRRAAPALLALALGLSAYGVAWTQDTPTAPPQNPLQRGDGWLGVSLDTIPLEEATPRGFKHPLVRVDNVFTGSPAHSSDFKADDVILAYNAEPITEVRQLVALVRGTEPGAKVAFTLLRGKQKLTVPLVLGVRPDRQGLLRGQLIDRPAPDFKTTGVHNAPKPALNLSDYKGKIVVLDFWATWCGPCRQTIPKLNALANAYKNKNVVVLGLSDEEPDTLRKFTQNNKVAYTLIADPSRAANKDYMVSAIPTLFLIDQAGTIREVHIGGGGVGPIEARIQQLLKSPPPAQAP